MSDLLIREDVFEGYIDLFKKSIKEHILELYNEDFLLNYGNGVKSYSFFDSFVIILNLKNDTINCLNVVSYESFISFQLINDLKQYEKLPARIERLKVLGVESLRKELIEQLQLGNIYIDNEGLFAVWEDFNVKFIFNKDCNKFIHLKL